MLYTKDMLTLYLNHFVRPWPPEPHLGRRYVQARERVIVEQRQCGPLVANTDNTVAASRQISAEQWTWIAPQTEEVRG